MAGILAEAQGVDMIRIFMLDYLGASTSELSILGIHVL